MALKNMDENNNKLPAQNPWGSKKHKDEILPESPKRKPSEGGLGDSDGGTGVEYYGDAVAEDPDAVDVPVDTDYDA